MQEPEEAQTVGKEKVLSKIPFRVPIPRPERPHGSKKGKRGYERTENSRLEREAQKEGVKSDEY